MSELAKTVAFLVVGAAAVGAAWTMRPAPVQRPIVDDTGQRFFEEFDPLDVASLEIVKYDEATGTAQPFKVAVEGGVWSIPSQEGYPADAKDQVAKAAAGIVDLLKGTSVSDRPGDHEQYGVVDPGKAASGASGVGTRVTLGDVSGSVLADLIIGKPVKDSEALHYVRLPQHDRVYMARVADEPLSTKFEDWIEKDLLQLNTWEIARIVVNDYSIDELNSRLIQGGLIELNHDQAGNQWTLADLQESEELNPGRIGDLTRALDDLQIVDVRRKPPGLSANLEAEEPLMLDQQALLSLQSRGYYVVQGKLLSNEGETVVGVKNGVQYTLRFGEIASVGSEEEGGAANRYVFLTADFNPDLVPAPALETLPDLPAEVLGSAQEEGQESAVNEALQKAREKIEQENARKTEEHEKKLQEGRDKVRDLNRRFAKWYYVISDEVYKKIRLTREDVVKPKGEEKDSG